jgi:hypothetical protein
MSIELLLQLCGVAHILLGVGSLVIPKMLDWKSALETTPLLIKQMFWTYAGYILFINVFFGIISILLAGEMLSGSGLAIAITLLISLYWIARLIIQFVYFDKREIPQGLLYQLGEWALVGLFIQFSAVYSYAFYINVML